MRENARYQEANHNLHQYGSPSPVEMFYGEINGIKVYDISGNIWRHSVSVLTVMDGFQTHPVYDDFTLPSIDGEHTHILGGSWISVGNVFDPETKQISKLDTVLDLILCNLQVLDTFAPKIHMFLMSLLSTKDK